MKIFILKPGEKHHAGTATGDHIVRKLGDREYGVYSSSHKIASASLSLDTTFVQDISVSRELQKQGIATALYKFIEDDLGKKLKPSPLYQTDAGKALWASRCRESKQN